MQSGLLLLFIFSHRAFGGLMPRLLPARSSAFRVDEEVWAPTPWMTLVFPSFAVTFSFISLWGLKTKLTSNGLVWFGFLEFTEVLFVTQFL